MEDDSLKLRTWSFITQFPKLDSLRVSQQSLKLIFACGKEGTGEFQGLPRTFGLSAS